MKKLILITGILLSTSLWASPMDEVCRLNVAFNDITENGWNHLEKNCERNNILDVRFIGQSRITQLVNYYCRFDRNVHIAKHDDDEWYDLGCVLYSNEGRKRIN